MKSLADELRQLEHNIKEEAYSIEHILTEVKFMLENEDSYTMIMSNLDLAINKAKKIGA